MILAAAVTIVLNGTIVATVMPARIAGGRVVAPLVPIVVRIATRVSYDPGAPTIALERDATRIVVPVVFVENEVPFVAIGPAVKRLGGSTSYDAATKTLNITLRSGSPIVSPSPFDPASPQVNPNTVFTPVARTTPRALETGIPRPRRTAIPAAPSQPVPPR